MIVYIFKDSVEKWKEHEAGGKKADWGSRWGFMISVEKTKTKVCGFW